VNVPSNFRKRFVRNFRVYIAVVLACLSAYFAYVVVNRGVSGAFSMQNLKWFGATLLYTSAVAGLIATLQGLAEDD
jgi:hypothetical protein